MIWQDIAFMAGGIVFIPSLLFCIYNRNKPPIRTSLPTGIVLAVFSICYATLGLWLAFVATLLTSILWFVISYQVYKERNEKRGNVLTR